MGLHHSAPLLGSAEGVRKEGREGSRGERKENCSQSAFEFL